MIYVKRKRPFSPTSFHDLQLWRKRLRCAAAFGLRAWDSGCIELESNRLQKGEAMSVTLSIDNTPDEVVAGLKSRAARNHRSLQDELTAIVTEAAAEETATTLGDIRERVRRLDLSSPNESVEIIRQMRDERTHDILYRR